MRRGDHRHAVDLAGAGDEVVGLLAGEPALQLRELVFERALPFEELAQPLGRLGRGDLEDVAGLAQHPLAGGRPRPAPPARPPPRSGARRRPPHPRCRP